MGRINIKSLGKAYKRYPRPLSRVLEWILPSRRPHHELHWVLRGIDINIEPGEAVGIIGINGAGKSTLLKMITGTTLPTEGEIQLSGRVAAILELGMGFHPDFTGRQNVFMAGQLLGLNAADISRLMPDIEAFAEIGEYLDQPVRIYSSGMQMRLAFSLATAKRPDILIVDEALSVGDAYFGTKCMERIRDYRNDGTTLLIVSHDKQAIQSLCNRALLLDGGRLAKEGDPESVMDFYNASLVTRHSQEITQKKLADGKTTTISGSGEAEISSLFFVDDSGNQIEVAEVGASVALIAKVTVRKPVNCLVFGYMLRDRLGQCIHGSNTMHHNAAVYDLKENEVLEYRIDFTVDLGPGEYSVSTALTSTDTHFINNYHWHDRASSLHVVNRDKPYFDGYTWLKNKVTVTRESP